MTGTLSGQPELRSKIQHLLMARTPGYEIIEAGADRYRGYTITRDWETKTGKPQPDEFTFVHDDYDGLDDRRCGASTSRENAIEQIEERILELDE